MITFDQAMRAAMAYLGDSEIPLSLTLHGEFSEGWYFCYQSTEYVDTGNPVSQLAGNAPFVVDKDTGQLYELGTAHPLEHYLSDYKRAKESDTLTLTGIFDQ